MEKRRLVSFAPGAIDQCRLSAYTSRMRQQAQKLAHPGVVVREECITPNGLTVTKAARILGVDRQTLSNLLNGRSGISPEMAVRLEKVFGTPARTWMERQLDFEYAEVMDRAATIRVMPFEGQKHVGQGRETE